MNDEHEPVSDYTFGYFSPTWMLKALLYWVPQERAWMGMARAIDYFTLNPDPDIGTALDILAQYAVNGEYTPTYEHDCSEHEEGRHPLDPTYTPEPGSPLGKEEQERLIAEFNAMMGNVPETKEGDDD